MNSRLYVVLAISGVWFAGLTGRLYQLQVVEHDHYVERAHGQQRSELVLTPPRGTIFDCRGRELAMSIEASSAFADPREIAEPSSTARRLASVLGGDDATLARELSREGRKFVWVARQLDPETVRELRDLEIQGLRFVNESKRAYPLGPLAAPLLGFVGVDPTGLAGVELSYDAAVAGQQVRRPVLRDARPGRKLYDDFSQPRVEPGADLHLTIDSSIQHVAERELAAAVERHGAKGGSLVMLDPSSGAVLAMASYPGFDPNDYQRAPREHLRNTPVQSAYEPGSTFKLITAAAALETGAVDPFDRFDCGNGGINFKGKYIRDHASFDDLSFSEVIAYSSNVGAIHLGVRAGEKQLYDMIEAFGFGSKTGIDLSGEAAGTVHPLEQWHQRAVAYTSFGQGLAVTPLQLVNAFAAIANGGTLYRPYVVAAVTRDGMAPPSPRMPQVLGRPISAQTARTLERMLEMVVENERGTGKHAAIPGYRVAGKTGTAEKAGDGGYLDDKFVASFVGFAPARSPAVVCLVVIDEPGGARYHGGDAPAAVFSAVVRHALLRLGIPRDDSLRSLDAESQVAGQTSVPPAANFPTSTDVAP